MQYSLPCVSCKKDRIFKSLASYRTTVSAGKLMCKSCSFRQRWRDEGYRDKFREMFTEQYRAEMSQRVKGVRNPFFGKRHTSETIARLVETGKASVGKRRESRGNYQIWVEKYGQAEADHRDQRYRHKQSVNFSGSNNPMYGKPAPMGSGNGWSGWYKDWFFRSLRELTYRINELEAHNLTWRTAENRDLRISYSWLGKERNYFADFLVEDKTLVECKPHRLHDTPLVIAKKLAAEAMCQRREFEYRLVDPGVLPICIIRSLHDDGSLRFMDRYEARFEEWCRIHD